MTPELKPCPMCGKPAKIYGENMVGCSDTVDCGANVDFGHWCGEENGIPAVNWVIEQWNTRKGEEQAILTERERLLEIAERDYLYTENFVKAIRGDK